MKNKSHGLEENDTMTYNDYLDNINAEMSPDTAPSLIPVLENGNITMKSLGQYADILKKAQEQITCGFISTNSDHSAIHRGYGYCRHLYFEELLFGSKKIYRITSPETLFMHIKSLQIGLIGATCSAKLIRGTTANPLVITNAGTEEPKSTNLNDNSSNMPQSKFYDGTVTYTGGEVWCEVVVRGSTSEETKQASAQQTAGQFIQNDYLEYVSKDNNTEYILEIENIDSEENTAFDITIDMFYYEEPKGLITNG